MSRIQRKIKFLDRIDNLSQVVSQDLIYSPLIMVAVFIIHIIIWWLYLTYYECYIYMLKVKKIYHFKIETKLSYWPLISMALVLSTVQPWVFSYTLPHQSPPSWLSFPWGAPDRTADNKALGFFVRSVSKSFATAGEERRRRTPNSNR